MDKYYLRRIIDECVRRVINEAGNISFKNTETPLVMQRLTGHAKGLDDASNPSTVDFEGERMRGKTEHIFVTDNKFLMYKVKNFGNPDVKDTLQFFGNTAEFRRAKDTIDGASKRGGKPVYYRTISPESERSKIERGDFMVKTFWEFSFDGDEWYIMKPQPVQTLKISKFIQK